MTLIGINKGHAITPNTAINITGAGHLSKLGNLTFKKATKTIPVMTPIK
jgi:hypothetical protein